MAELLGHAKALRDAKPPFDLLTEDERREQFQALIGDVYELPDGVVVDLAGRCSESIVRRLRTNKMTLTTVPSKPCVHPSPPN